MQAEPKRSVEADEFVLRDGNGTARAVLKMTVDGPGLFLYDQSEKIRAGLVGGRDASGLVVLDSQGKPRISLDLGAGDVAERRYRTLATAAATLVLATNAIGETLEDSPSWRAYSGQTFEEIKGTGWLFAVFAEDRPRLEGQLQHGRQSRAPFEAEIRIRRHDGEFGEFTLRAAPVFHVDESVSEWVFAATDISASKRLAETLRATEERLAAESATKSQLELNLRTTEEARVALTNSVTELQANLQTTEGHLSAANASIAQLQESLRTSEEGRNSLVTSSAQLQESLRLSEANLATANSTVAQLQQSLRVSEQGRNSLAASSAQLQESLRQSEANLATANSNIAQLQETLRISEEGRNASMSSAAQLQEALRLSELNLSAANSSLTQLQESYRISEEGRKAVTASAAQLQDSLRLSEQNVANLNSNLAQLQESFRISEEGRNAAQTSAAQLQESLRASEERFAAASATIAQLQESLRINEENRNSLIASNRQLQSSLDSIQQQHANLSAAKLQVDEALRISERGRESASTLNAQLQESLRQSEERAAAEAAAKAQLDLALRAHKDRVAALSAAKTNLEETIQTNAESHATSRRLYEDALKAGQEQLNEQIVARGRAEETLRSREEHHRAVTAAVGQLVWSTTYAGELLEHSPSWRSFTGQSAEESRGLGWLQALHPEDRERTEEALKAAVETRSASKTEFRLRRHDGAYRVMALRGAPIIEYDGAVYEWIGTASDVTEEKQAEILRRASEKRYQQIVERAPEGIWILDPENRTTFANPCLAQMLGSREEEMPGRSLFDFLDEPGRKVAEENLDCCRRGVAVQFDLKLRTNAGEDIWTHASTLPLFDEAGQYSGALALMIDITEQRLLQGQQTEARKLQALSQLAGGVAHGLNNFLTVINGYTDLLLGKIPRTNPLHESVSQIKKAGDQAGDLVTPLLAFSQGQILWPKALNLNDLVAEAEKNLRVKHGEDLHITTLLTPKLGLVEADPEQMQKILATLTENAVEAMHGRGTVVIETQNIEFDEAYAAKHPGTKQGQYVHLRVTDNGAGMDAEALSHLFEPFYTTKSKADGSGLGLSSVYGIVKQSGGSITTESEPGKGTTFHIYLPRATEAAPVVEEGKPAITMLRGTETVLIVEDQEEIRKLAQTVLKSYGYKVVVAANGWEALLYSERHVGPIHLMISDVMMPGMTGQELAARLKPLRPEMDVIFMSGYVEDGLVQPRGMKNGTGFLAKPFSPETLATKVREVLGPARSVGVVVVVDRDEENRSFMQTVLGSMGYAVVDAESIDRAVQLLNGRKVDLLLVDLGKSSQQDVDVVRTLLNHRPDAKVVAMSGSFGDEFLRASEQIGALATLSKPIRADQLLDTIRRAMGG
jgi:PAS domain S-box-containing protein